jgi:hypothetical protein
LQPDESKSNTGEDVANFDGVKDPEDPAVKDPKQPGKFLNPFGEDVEAFTRFMRSTMPPPPDAQAEGRFSLM